ncbi:hypothetical protein OFQ66_04100 [Brachyspira hyodysenteriae]|nr:hypothetical protein [Brachyspira hyodysenteriae]
MISHAGLDIDKKIAQEMPNTFNIIIGGHTHTLLKNPIIIGKNNYSTGWTVWRVYRYY